jgi:isoleucyl-tRNA synthetase
MFHQVDSKVDFARREKEILSYWKEGKVFSRSVEGRKEAPQYVFYEGPPTANGSPGIHHVLSRLFKDVVCRYKTMKGFYVPRKAGWDSHGLPVELEVEDDLGLTSKAQIEKYGMAKFNRRCRESVFKYIKEWEAVTERTGCWLDMENAYKTLDNGYIESCWWAIKQMWKKGLVYQGYKVTPHCPRCGTSLSSHEVALGYRDDAEDPSVYIKFKVDPLSLIYGDREHDDKVRELVGLFQQKPAYFLAWTTTPWTLPGNTALAVAPDAEYSVVDNGEEYLILASALLGQVGLGDCEVLTRVKGKELVGLHYEPLYNIPIGYSKGDKLAYRIIEGEFVSMDEGTGIVHIAPAYGEIDFEVGEREGLPLIHSVDLSGRVVDIPTGLTPRRRKRILEGLEVVMSPVVTLPVTPGRGKFVKDADPLIIADLKSRGLLYRSGTITHTYPFCWRCESPLLYYAKEAWYIKTTAVKDRLTGGNDEINWYPGHIKYGRFGDWLENNVDWAVSRERYWGTPLNIWRCQSCGRVECVEGVDDLKARLTAGEYPAKAFRDLHRPYIDEITFPCPGCGKVMRRVPEVIDCWFDSGAMPVAQWHYPFENKEQFERNFPADFICEAIDQTRGWFYSLHAISTLLFDHPCFKNVICLGHVVDAQGEKMSKSKNNVVDPWQVMDSYGADALRWYLLTSAPGENVHRFSTTTLEEAMRKDLLTLWNTYSFFVLYANIDRFVPRPGEAVSFSPLDSWTLSELNRLTRDVTRALDGYDLTPAARRVGDFVDGLSNWYVRRSRRRFWKSGEDADKRAAYTTLYHCLETLSRLLAPFVPFIAEELYRNLVCSVNSEAPQSVHLSDFPEAEEDKIDDGLNDEVRLAMRIASLGRAARAKAGIKVRQPLTRAVVVVSQESEKSALQKLSSDVMEEINVKKLEFAKDRLGEALPGYALADDGKYQVAVETELSPELVAEGLSREIVRHIQTMRRAAGFDVADHIVTCYQGEERISRVMKDFGGYIKQETLSRELTWGPPPEGAYAEKRRISDSDVLLAVKKA